MSEQQSVVDGPAMLAALGVPDESDPASLAPYDGDDAEEMTLPDTPVVADAGGVVAHPPAFRARRAVLAGQVEQVMLAVPSKDFYPAFKTILINVSEGMLTLTGSNSAIAVVSSSVAVQVERPGSVMVPGAKFAAVVRGAEGADISVSVSESEVRILSGRGSWTLRTSQTQEYPPLPGLEDLSWVEVDRLAFDRAVRGTRYAAGSDEQRDHYMQLDFSGGACIASDGVRYAQANVGLPSELSIQLATAGVDLVSKMLANNDAREFRIADASHHTVVEVGPASAPDRAIIAHLMRELPAEARNAIAVPRGANRDQCEVGASELLSALGRAKPTGDTETGAVLLQIDPAEITVISRNRYGDSSSEAVGCRFATLGSDKAPKRRTISVVRDHLVKAVMAAQRVTQRSEEAEEGDAPVVGDVVLLLGEDRSKARLAPVLVQDPEGVTQAVLSQVRSEWLS